MMRKLLIILSLFAAAHGTAQPGSWKQLGDGGNWIGTLACVEHKGQIYTIETSGAMFVTDPVTATWKLVGNPDFANTRFFLSASDHLYTIEKSGSLYQVDPLTGAWKQLGKDGVWVNTIAAATLNGKMYTVEKNGALYVTDLQNGTWNAIGKPEFGSTAGLFAAHGKLYSIETSGSLYEIDPASGTWKQLGQASEWLRSIAAVVVDDHLYSIESSGALYETDLLTGKWKQLGTPEFANTGFLTGSGGKLHTIEKNGFLYEVSIR